MPSASAGEILWGSCIKDDTALCPANVNHGTCRVNFYRNDNVGELKFRIAVEGNSCWDILRGRSAHLLFGGVQARAQYYTIKATPCWRCR